MKVAIMGYGTIGSGVAEVLEVNRDVIAKRCQEPLELKYVLDLRDFAGDPIADKVVHDYKVIAEDPEVAIVVETMGGVEPAYTFVKAMLEKGKHVATSNKALVADRGAELIEIARAHKVNFLFGASVGGGIPIIRPLQSCLTGDVIERITGIINGTTNYMMTKMTREGSDFDEVLADAQDKGYAEKDPTADIEGYDACRKIAILTSLVCGKQVDYQDIPTEGISHITATDIRYANAMGRAIKLLADSKMSGDTYSVRVAPFLLLPDHPLYHVDGVFNAIFVHGNMLGDGMFYGSGAGKLPTASAVVADVVDEAKHLHRNIMTMWKNEKLTLLPIEDTEKRFFVRISGSVDERLGEIENVFGPVRKVTVDELNDEFGIVTEVMTEGEYQKKSSRINGILHMIRIED